MSSIAEQDIKATRRVEDKAANTVENMMNTFAFNIGNILEKGDDNIIGIKLQIEKILDESGFDEAISDITNNDYQTLINQSHDLYSGITGEKSIIIKDEEPEQPKKS